MLKNFNRLVICVLFLLITTGCVGNKMTGIPLVKQVDLAKFMGDWYVIAVIPTAIETDAYNPLENYQLNDDGTIATTFTFNKGSFDGKAKKYEPKGFVRPDTGNALWGMQFIWPIKAEYRISYLDEAYQTTIIARNARDYVWLMARAPQISDVEYNKAVALIKSWDYDTTKLIKVPQQALSERRK